MLFFYLEAYLLSNSYTILLLTILLYFIYFTTHTKGAIKKKKFIERSDMHYKIMRIINITQVAISKRVNAVHALFVQYDTNGKGELTANTISNMVRGCINVQMSIESLTLFVNALDKDGDGFIEFDELLSFFLKGLAQSTEKRKEFSARSEFHLHLDTNHEF